MAVLTRAWLACPALLMLASVAAAASDAGDKAPNPMAGAVVVTLSAIVVFLLLLATLRKTAYPQIVNALAQRERLIEESLTKAERAADEAKQIAADVEKQLTVARQEASAVVEKAKQDAQLVAAKEIEEARKEIHAERDRAQREIQIARDTALQQVVDQATELASALAGRILKREINPQQHRDLVSQVVDELRN